MARTAVANPASNSTMKLARTSSEVKPPARIRHDLSEPDTEGSVQPVTLDYLEGFRSFS
jgi:hypothetical protein